MSASSENVGYLNEIVTKTKALSSPVSVYLAPQRAEERYFNCQSNKTLPHYDLDIFIHIIYVICIQQGYGNRRGLQNMAAYSSIP